MLISYLRYGAAEANRDQGSKLHHLEEQEAEAEAECQGVEEVTNCADHLKKKSKKNYCKNR